MAHGISGGSFEGFSVTQLYAWLLPSLIFLQPKKTDGKPCNITARDCSQTKYAVLQLQVTSFKVSKEQSILCIVLPHYLLIMF